jgi:protein-tyrosine phosphatase
MPIKSFSTPSRAEMIRTLDTIDTALAGGQTVYVHCWAGIGRTGTVVGCYLVRHGLSGTQALEEIAQLRQGTPHGGWTSPETEAQRQMVLNWAEEAEVG